MKERLGEEWYNILKEEFSKGYMQELQTFLLASRAAGKVYPESKDVFNAYKYTPYSKVRVCIIGQDPYINGEAHGLAFSGKDNQSTPSLRKIAEAVDSIVWTNDLTRWAEQGIFLLNSVLTVDAGKSASHKDKGWEIFTKRTIQELEKKGNVIFLLWGKDAQQFDKYITKGLNAVITCEHPVAASYHARKWEFNDCFNRTNQILTDLEEKKIIW